MKMPLVSILLAIYNTEKSISKVINSIKKQTYGNWELIIINDGSDDNTYQKISYMKKNDSRIIIKNLRKNIGKAKALNYGLDFVNGEYILEIDGDDWLHRDAINNFVHYAIKEKANTGLLYSDYKIIKKTGNKTNVVLKKGRAFIDRMDWINNFFVPIPRFYRTSALKEIGGWAIDYPSEGRLYEDIATILKLLSKYQMAYIPKMTMYISKHKRNITYSNRHAWSSIYKYLLAKTITEWNESYKIEVNDKKNITLKEKIDKNNDLELISLIIPYCNHQHYIKYMLQGIVNQNYKKIQLIFINDNSTDRTNSIIDSFLINENIVNKKVKVPLKCSKGEKLNIALKNVKGKYFMIVNPFEILNPEALELLIGAIEKNKKNNEPIVCAYGNQRAFEVVPKFKFNHNEKNIHIKSHYDLFESKIPPRICVFNTNSVKNIGGYKDFSKKINPYQIEYMLLVNLLFEGEFIHIPKYLGFTLQTSIEDKLMN